jgi:hypothetical protein
VQEAKQLWIATGLTTAQRADLNALPVLVTNLSDSLLGLTTPHAIWIDATAAGRGWFLDATAIDPNVFVHFGGAYQALPGSLADGRVDLLTVVTHELGHLLGLSDIRAAASSANVMADFLSAGIRRLPSGMQALTPPNEAILIATEAADALFAGNHQLPVKATSSAAGNLLTELNVAEAEGRTLAPYLIDRAFWLAHRATALDKDHWLDWLAWD